MQKGSTAQPRRIYVAPPAGLDTRAPYWHGERAKHIINARLTATAAAKEAKRLAARSKKRTTSSPSDLPGKVRTRSQSSTLRRLERALVRRKTLDAQQRIRAQIKALKAELGL